MAVAAAAAREDVQISVEEVYAMWEPATYRWRASIFRVPNDLKKVKKDAYVPKLVGLGPYHHSNSALQNLRSHKMEALRRALRRILFLSSRDGTGSSSNNSVTLESLSACLDKLRKLVKLREQEIRGFYDQELEFSPDVFILDSLFLLEFCISIATGTVSDSLHPYFDYQRLNSVVGFSIARDALKLENQIPLSLLMQLLKLQGWESSVNFVNLFHFILDRIPLKGSLLAVRAHEILLDLRNPPRHILEWIHRLMVLYIRGGLPEQQDHGEISRKVPDGKTVSWICFKRKKVDHRRSVPRVEELKKAGIAVKVAERLAVEERCFGLKAVLKLPKLSMDDSSEVILRNVMAFEECLGLSLEKAFFNRYMRLMSDLIHKESDVAMLRKAGVIDNYLESDQEVADIFNRLGAFITIRMIPEIDDRIERKLREYHQSSIRVMTKEFLESYFSRPWYVSAAVAAIIMLVCTMLQTIYTVKSS